MARDDLMGNFVGREMELDALQRWHRHSRGSILAVLGPPGVGKTALIRRFIAEVGELTRPSVWLSARELRSVEALIDTLRSKLHDVRQFKSATVILDDIEEFGQRSETASKLFREMMEFDRVGHHTRWRGDVFNGDLNWLLVGRRFPWQSTESMLAPQDYPDHWETMGEGMFMRWPGELHAVELPGLRETEIDALLGMLMKDGPHVGTETRLGLAAQIKSRTGGNPRLISLVIEEIKRTGDPIAAISALNSRANLAILLAGNSLKVTASAELAPVQLSAPGGVETVFPHLYLPKLAQRWRDAIGEFQVLLNDPRLKEAQLQSFFETHPHFLKGLDYSRLVAHPVLERLDGKGDLIPDFFLQPSGGKLADIWDLKLPSCPLIVGTKDRLHLSSAVNTALAQVREYRDYFEDPKNRQKIADRYGLTAYRPTVAVVIGTNKFGLSEEKQKQIFDAVPKDAKVVTYDDLLTRMKRHVELYV